MMSLSLTVRDRYRQAREVSVGTSRFTIGSAAENDLRLEGLLERQAVIECFENVAEVTDFGSRGAMRVNGHSANGSVRLGDGNVISLSGGYELIVHLVEQEAKADIASAQANAPPTKPTRWLSVPLIVVVFLFALLAGGVLYSKVSSEPSDTTGDSDLPGRPKPTPSPLSLSATAEPTLTISADEQQLQQVLASARRTMECISYDGQGYPFPEERVEHAIKDRVIRYRQQPETVAAALRAVSQHQVELLAQSRKSVSDNPSLMLYLVLAEMVANPAASPPAIARKLAATLPERRIKIGNDAQSTLILVAGQQLDEESWKRFKARIDGSEMLDPTRQRNVWWLYQQGKLNEAGYQFVLDFLALSLIAQSPRDWLSSDAPKLECVPGQRR